MDLLSTASCEQRPPWHLQQKRIGNAVHIPMEEVPCQRERCVEIYSDTAAIQCVFAQTWPDISGLWHVLHMNHLWLDDSQGLHIMQFQSPRAPRRPIRVLTQFIPGTQKPHDQFLPLFWVFCWLTRGVHSPKGPDQTLPPKLSGDRRRNYSRCLGS